MLAVLFDVDGTLISSGGAGAASWRMAFDDLYGVPVDIGKYTDAGMTEPEVASLTFRNVLGRDPTAQELARLMATRMRHLPQTVAESQAFRVLPGVRGALDRLRAADYLLGVTTGGVEAAAHIKLARAHLDHYFSFGGFGSDSSDRIELTRRALARASALLGRPLDPRQVLVVGDTPHDIEAAHGAGAVAVGVATGHFSEEALRAAGADYVLSSLEQELPLFGGGHEVKETLVLEDPVGDAAERLATVASAGGQIALTGGSTARLAYERLAPTEVDWSRCTLWFGDERCVPPGDERSNFGMFRESAQVPVGEGEDRLALGQHVQVQLLLAHGPRLGGVGVVSDHDEISSARSCTTTSAPCSRRACAWPDRSTPTT
jgi:phosphoglycolate phosphatase-like HAD superfamily hydrolase